MIIFDPKSAYKHFDEDRLDEDGIRKAMAHPEWIALIDPADLIEVLARPQGRDMLVFHVEHLTDKWRTYWMEWRQGK